MATDTVESGTLAKTPASALRARPTKWMLILLPTLVASAGLFAWFIWPTAYRWDHMNVGGDIYPVRIERWSGRAAIMSPSGWKSVAGKEKPGAKATELPSGELARLETTGEGRFGEVFVHLYNGSSFHVNQITVELVVWEKANGRELLRRLYAVDSLYPGSSVKPRSSSQFSFDPHFAIGADHAWSFQLVGAKGYPAE